ncbi:MAG: M48 family metallopeptidase [Lachnospiraceae bacterium]|jgi:predicted metal-dependent hydrolase|nr:M48 family metallopeptidase [Lachnospiraceae bacterium]
MDLEYTFIKSRRKTVGISIKRDGTVVLRAPLFCTKKRAEQFLLEKMDWVLEARARVLSKSAASDAEPFTDTELKEIKKKARQTIPPMVERVAAEMGATYGRISIRAQRSRWGSCSGTGNLNFNCLLVLLPANVMRYVIVHELCHLKEMNHSKAFWAEVAKFQPTYKLDRKELKTEGEALIARIP